MSDSQPPTPLDPEPEPVPDQTPPPAVIYTLPPRRSLLRFLAEHNPFYLLSAACMLASCLALTNSLSWMSIERGRLITLIVTLNVYEAALLAIAIFLIKQRKLRRDGRILLLLQAFFLADFSFLNAEIATADFQTGLAINLVLLALAAIKMGVVLRVLKPGFTALQFAFVMLQLTVLFVSPVVLRWTDANRSILNPRDFYVMWWIVGLLPAAYELLTHADRGRIMSVSADAQTAPTTAYLSLPFVSLLLHLGIIHWVYRVDYVGAHAAPLLLGLTLVINRFGPSTKFTRPDLVFLRAALPAAAVLVSLNQPFVFDLGIAYPRLVVTPLNLSIAGAFFVYLYCFLMPWLRMVLVAGAAAAMFYFFGPTWQQIDRFLMNGWDRGMALADRAAPKTLGEWGVLGLIASFAFLAIGFAFSLRKHPESSD